MRWHALLAGDEAYISRRASIMDPPVFHELSTVALPVKQMKLKTVHEWDASAKSQLRIMGAPLKSKKKVVAGRLRM